MLTKERSQKTNVVIRGLHRSKPSLYFTSPHTPFNFTCACAAPDGDASYAPGGGGVRVFQAVPRSSSLPLFYALYWNDGNDF